MALPELELAEAQAGRRRLNLAEIYATFMTRFGDTSKCFDDWKSAFCFPFELEICRNDAVYYYILEVTNWRSTFEFRFRKVLPTDESAFDRMAYHASFENELSTGEMNGLMAYLYGFSMGYLETVSCGTIEEFIRQVPSNLILFGFHRGEFFEHYHNDADELSAAWLNLRKSSKAAEVFSRTTADAPEDARRDVEVMWDSEPSSDVATALKQLLRRHLVTRFGPLPAWADAWVDHGGLARFEGWMARISDATDLVTLFFHTGEDTGSAHSCQCACRKGPH